MSSPCLYDCGLFVCRYAYALYQARFNPITYVDLHLEKPPLKTAITQSTFFNFDDLEVTLLRAEVGVLIDNLAKVYSRVERKLAAKPKEAEENINSDLKEDRIEEEKIQSEFRNLIFNHSIMVKERYCKIIWMWCQPSAS